MDRVAVYAVLDQARIHQRLRWGLPDVAGVLQEVPKTLPEFIHHIRTFLTDAGDAATHDPDPTNALKELRAVAALCVACFEQHGVPSMEMQHVVNKRDGRAYLPETFQPVLGKRKREATS